MALRLREIALSLGEVEASLPEKIASILEIEKSRIVSWKIVRKGIDARRKSSVLRVYTVEFDCTDESDLLQQKSNITTLSKVTPAPAHEFIH